MKLVVSLLLVFGTLILLGESKRILGQYVLRKERILSDYRLAEFSVYDAKDQKRLYTLKSFTSDIHSAELRSSTELVGALEGTWITEIDNATVTYLDGREKQWKDAHITPAKHLLVYKYIIQIGQRRLVMKSQMVTSSTVSIRDEKSNDLFAEFKRTSPWFRPNTVKYNLKVYSNLISERLYFFAIAVMDHRWMLEVEKSAS